MEPGFTTIVTPMSYECNSQGEVTDFDDSSLRSDWVDGIEKFGWWCPECHEWYNDAEYREADDDVFVTDDEEDDEYRCISCGRLTDGIYCNECETDYP